MASTSVDDASRWLAERSAKLEEALAELVRVNSFTDNAEGGREVRRILEGLFPAPFARTVVPSARYADHLVLTSTWTPARPERGRVALVGHLDTVFPPGTFEGYRRDGDLARGPGVLDMKGGLVVVAFALAALAETFPLEDLPAISAIVVADEEVGSPEGKGVIERALADASACLVFEAGRPGDLVVTRRKGTGAMTLRAQGKAAHAGNDHASGANAVWALARLVDRVQSLTDYARGVTVNVGKISGGESKNTVPDRAEALVDLRFETRADAEALVAAIGRHAEAVERELPGVRLACEGGVARLPMERTPASEALLASYGDAARAAGLAAGEAPLVGGGSDASTSSALGIASIDGLGPRGLGFHTKDERIEIATLVLKAQALVRWLAARAAAP